MKYKTINDIDVIPLLIKLFTQNNIVLLENPNIKPGKRIRQYYSKLSLQYPKKIRIIKFNEFIGITFNHKMIQLIYNFLKLKPVNKDNIHTGGRIIHNINQYKIV